MTDTRTRAYVSISKYYQGPGEINRLEKYTSKFGHNVLAIIGGTFFSEFSKKLSKDYNNSDSSIDFIKFDAKQHEVSYNQIERMVKECKKENYSVVVGMGGGKVLDMAKAIAWKLDTNLIIFPTSASSDAPTTSFSVIYTDEGAYSELLRYKRNPDIVLVDSEIISKSPVRLFVAGMGDALSTYIGVRACIESNAPNLIGDGYRRTLTGYAIAKCCYDKLFEQGLKAKLAVEKGLCNEAVEDIIEVNTLMSGLGAECNGDAGAHGFHDGLTNSDECRDCLHGELVSFGIICQLVLENRDYEEMMRTSKFLLDVGLPITLEDLGCKNIKKEELRNIAQKMVNSMHMENEPFPVTEDMILNAILGGDAMGQHFKQKYHL